MQVFDNRSGFTVTVTAREVVAFARTWPCSGLAAKPVTFSFDNDGNLVDANDAVQHPRANGSALLALSQDACAHGSRRLRRLRRAVLTVATGGEG